MSIASTDERLSAYLDGDLSPEERAALEHELAHDADLRADLDALRLVVSTLRDEGPLRAPLGFHVAVMDRIEQEHPEAPWWQRFLQRPFGIPPRGWGVVLAAAAVLVVVQLGGGDDAPPVDADPVWRDVPTDADAEPAPAAVKLPAKQEAAATKEAVPAEAAPRPVPQAKEDPLVKEREAAARAEAERLAKEDEARKAEAAGSADDTSAKPVLRTPPSGLTLLTRDPSSLREVLALVARFGGTVTTPSGGAVTHATLESSEESVVVSIPSAQLAAFQKALEALGSVQTSFDSDRLYGGNTLEVPLTFKLVGGSSGTGDAAAPAAAKQRKALDLEAAEPE